MKCSPVSIEWNLLPFRLFLTSVSVSGMWACGIKPYNSHGSGTATCRSFIYMVPSWNGVCSSVSADKWSPWNCLATCGFFHSSEMINQSSVWKAALHHICTDLWHYQDGFCLSSSQCIAWRQRYVISGRCNLALQSCFMQKQKSLHFYYCTAMKHLKKSTNQPTRWKLHVHSV